MSSHIVARAVIQNEAGDILLLRRNQSDSVRPGDWDLPGGGVERGETIEAAVSRELQEEAGLNIDPSELMLFYANTEFSKQQQKSITRLMFLGRTSMTDVLLGDEHNHAEWFDIPTALQKFPHHFYATGLRYGQTNGLIAAEPLRAQA